MELAVQFTSVQIADRKGCFLYLMTTILQSHGST